jgi:hypothetical protein
MNTPLRAAALCLAQAASARSVRAADTGAQPEPEPVTASDRLAAAREQIAAKRWERAIAELKRVNLSSSADCGTTARATRCASRPRPTWRARIATTTPRCASTHATEVRSSTQASGHR